MSFDSSRSTSVSHEIAADTYQYLIDNGFTREEYRWFREHGRALKASCIMGYDYYVTNEQILDADGKTEPSREIFGGYHVLTCEYYQRYRSSIMYTETNNLAAINAQYWLRKEWANAVRLKKQGVPLVGFNLV